MYVSLAHLRSNLSLENVRFSKTAFPVVARVVKIELGSKGAFHLSQLAGQSSIFEKQNSVVSQICPVESVNNYSGFVGKSRLR